MILLQRESSRTADDGRDGSPPAPGAFRRRAIGGFDAAFTQRREGPEIVDPFHPIDVNNSIQVVCLVFQRLREEPSSPDPILAPVEIKGPCCDALRTGEPAPPPREAEAPFINLSDPSASNDLGVDEDISIRLNVGVINCFSFVVQGILASNSNKFARNLDHCDPEQRTDLVGRDTNAAFGVHRRHHVIHEPLHRWSEAADSSCTLAQNRIR